MGSSGPIGCLYQGEGLQAGKTVLSYHLNGQEQQSMFLSLPRFLFGIAKIQSCASLANNAFLHSSFYPSLHIY